MKASPIYSDKQKFSDGSILEVKIWKVPKPLPGSPHPYKYRLFYGFPGERVVAYDNERGKGDHKHLRSDEVPYRFESVERLVRDFFKDAEEAAR